MAKFSVPFNGDLALADEAAASGFVSEIYFALPEKGSGASEHFVPVDGAPAAGARQVAALAALCRRRGVGLNLLCNAPSLAARPTERTIAAARALKVDSVTLADPLFLGRFRDALPGVRLQTSVIMNVNSVERARQALAAGARTLTLAAEASRNLALLEGVQKLRRAYPDLRVKLMANYYCGYDCVFMHAHYLSAMFPGGSAPGGPGGACSFRPGADHELLKRPFIRPEDLSFYEKRGLADEFKLIARYQPSAVLRRIYKAYFSRSYKGDLNELMGGRSGDYGKRDHLPLDNSRFPAGFAAKVAACGKDCAACGYCRRVFARVCAAGRRRARR